jgi:Uncharacterized protein involved in exopolysaccharide biosynthesis
VTSSDRNSTYDESEIDLMALWQVVWDRKYLIALITAFCAGVAVFLALTATPIYRAEAVITEVNGEGMSGAASLTNQLGGLASLVGVNLGGRGGANREARAILGSRHLIEEFIQRHNLAAELLQDSKQPPLLWFAVQRFREGVLTMREDKDEGTTIVAVDWTDPVIAARWANEFVALANEIIRTRAMNDSKRNISYLNDQIARTNMVEVQRVMYNLIETETKTLMLANGRVEYAFTVVDPAVSPQIRIRPRRTVMVLLGLVLGLFTGIMVAFAHKAVVRHKRSAAQSP